MARIRVLVVDDSVVIRKLVSDLLAADPDIEVVGTAVNGRAGLQKIALLKPDLVTMDIEMPELDGIETVRELRGDRQPRPDHHVQHADRARSRRHPRRPRGRCLRLRRRSRRTSAASRARWSRCATR